MKQEIVELDDGWAKVKRKVQPQQRRKPSRGRTTKAPARTGGQKHGGLEHDPTNPQADSATQTSTFDVSEDGSPTPPEPSRATLSVIEDVQRCLNRWQETKCRQRLVANLLTHLNVHSHVKRRVYTIDTAVCVGLGHLVSDERDTRNVVWQLVMFLDLVSWLEDRIYRPDTEESGEAANTAGTPLEQRNGEEQDASAERKVKMWAQDPVFSQQDAAVLRAVGIEVIPWTNGSTRARDKITPSTFLFAPFLPFQVIPDDLLVLERLKGKAPRLRLPAMCVSVAMAELRDIIADFAIPLPRKKNRAVSSSPRILTVSDFSDQESHGEILSAQQLHGCWQVLHELERFRIQDCVKIPEFELAPTAFYDLVVEMFEHWEG